MFIEVFAINVEKKRINKIVILKRCKTHNESLENDVIRYGGSRVSVQVLGHQKRNTL